MKKSTSIRIAMLGIFSALIILMTCIPAIGYLMIPGIGISATLIHIPVIIGAIVLGVRDGAILGAVWGITSMLRAIVMPQTVLDPLFANPLLSVVPRRFVGLVAALVFRGLCRLMQKSATKDIWAAAVAGIAGALVNTILVLGLLALLYPAQAESAFGEGTQALSLIIGTIVSVNGVIEIISAAIVSPAIARALFAVQKRLR